MTKHADQPLLPTRQPLLRFTREGPHLPRTAMAECQALLTRLLVESAARRQQQRRRRRRR